VDFRTSFISWLGVSWYRTRAAGRLMYRRRYRHTCSSRGICWGLTPSVTIRSRRQPRSRLRATGFLREREDAPAILAIAIVLSAVSPAPAYAQNSILGDKRRAISPPNPSLGLRRSTSHRVEP